MKRFPDALMPSCFIAGSDHSAELTSNSDSGAGTFANKRYALTPAPESA